MSHLTTLSRSGKSTGQKPFSAAEDYVFFFLFEERLGLPQELNDRLKTGLLHEVGVSITTVLIPPAKKKALFV